MGLYHTEKGSNDSFFPDGPGGHSRSQYQLQLKTCSFLSHIRYTPPLSIRVFREKTVVRFALPLGRSQLPLSKVPFLLFPGTPVSLAVTARDGDQAGHIWIQVTVLGKSI